MHLFYIPDILQEIQQLPFDESAHCVKVLRLKKGDIAYLTDGNGGLFKARIIDDNAKKCTLRIFESQYDVGKKDFKIHIAVAPTKNINRMEWFLEKATEIGIDEITPLLCSHSERKVLKMERLNKIIETAMKQSLKTYHPLLKEMIGFEDFIRTVQTEQKFIAVFSESVTDHLKDACKKGKDAVVLIGPEGDFSQEEIKLAMENGFDPVSLGPSRLRTETAAVIACHTINLVNGD